MARVLRDDSLLTVTGHTGRVNAVAFGLGGDGRPLLASASSDQTVRLWDPDTGDPVGDPLRGHTDDVCAVAFGVAGDGRPLLASASNDWTVRLWDPDTGATIVTLLRRTSPTAVATHGTQLAIADSEGITVVEVVGSAG
jgi:WD40 repeat protein